MRVLGPALQSLVWGSGIGRRSTQSIWLLRPEWLDNRNSTLGGHTQGLVHTGTQGKSNYFKGAWFRPTCWSWWVFWRGRGGFGSLWGQGHWWQTYQSVLIGVSVPGGCHFETKVWPHPTAYRLQCWDASGQTTSRAGTQSHPSADRLPKVSLSPWRPPNTPLDTSLLARGTRHSSIHQCAGTTPSHQEACTSLLGQLHPPGGRHQKQEELQCCSLQHKDHKHRKLDKMRWQRNMFQMKEQDKTPREN